MDKLVIAAMWESTLGFWNAPQLSETKKLQWCIDNKSVKRREQASALAHSDTVESSACENCLQKRSMLSRRRNTHLNDDNICALCATPLCSSCRVKKTLKMHGEHRAKLLNMEVAVCQACILFAQKQCPATIATHNQKQRQAVNERSRSASWRLTQESMWDQPTFSPRVSAVRYPSISMSDSSIQNQCNQPGIHGIEPLDDGVTQRVIIVRPHRTKSTSFCKLLCTSTLAKKHPHPI
ncbi:hypothetical protein JG688_00016480 [Phytophthora aleatoria]|uniref:Uncharacterized protein n=1 Tax=Phytophthora aleatoria TaxID=2496075 RepID=A0A8J5IE50_9STRA|nr:hypothetical protein JG688_00016480 [Phytophthora aleatoria]